MGCSMYRDVRVVLFCFSAFFPLGELIQQFLNCVLFQNPFHSIPSPARRLALVHPTQGPVPEITTSSDLDSA
jgi:hypothetical protein